MSEPSDFEDNDIYSESEDDSIIDDSSNEINISLEDEDSSTIILSKILYKKDIDAEDIDFDINKVNEPLKQSMLMMVEILTDRGDTNIKINNIHSITSNQTRVQYIQKMSKEIIQKISVDPNRKNGLDIVCIIKNKNDNNKIIMPILLDRLKNYNERIRIWNINDTLINISRKLNYINEIYDKITLTIITDEKLIEEIKNKCKISCLKRIYNTDPMIKNIGAVFGDIIKIEDEISIDYRYVSN